MAGSKQFLTKGLERSVLAIVRRYLNEHPVTEKNSGSTSLSVSQVYQYVITDRSMARQKERNLERMIEMALATIREEEAEPNSWNRELGEIAELDEEGLMEPKQVDDSTLPASQAPPKRKKPQPNKDSESIKRQKQNIPLQQSKNVCLEDIGGRDEVINHLLEFIVMHLVHPEIDLHTGVQPPCGLLLHGPPGCGKTMLVNAIAGEVGVPLIAISSSSIVSGVSGESEKLLRDLFEEAQEKAPCLIFIDEIDAITQKRDNTQSGMEKRIVTQMLTCMDDLTLRNTGGKRVMIICATNRPDSLDPALRRPGRFDKEICLDVPDESGREKILRILCERLAVSGDFDVKKLAKKTAGFVGADLSALVREASEAAVRRLYQSLANGSARTPPLEVATVARFGDSANIDMKQVDNPLSAVPGGVVVALESDPRSSIRRFHKAYPHQLTKTQLDSLYITFTDFLTGLKIIQPSCKREGFATVPDVTWADVGAPEPIKVELQMAIVLPIKNPEIFAGVGLTTPSGVLLWGPPGCGKTLLAKAVAHESGANFISIQGAELLNKYVGESERAVRQVFSRAKASIPCVMFFDELDALAPHRNSSLSESSSRVVNTLLTELDGFNDRKGIYIIAATNRPDTIDPSILRPGRLDTLLFVGLPDTNMRFEILKKLTKGTPLSNVNLRDIAEDDRCKHFSGADLAALVKRASTLALRQSCITVAGGVGGGGTGGNLRVLVKKEHFEREFGNMRPSVPEDSREQYQELATIFCSKVQQEHIN